MQIFENIRLAFVSITANKMRSFLTMLGIIIGISAVITITTIGSSIQKTLINTFNSIGNMNYFYVYSMYDSSYEPKEEDDVEINYNDDDCMTRSMLNELIETYPEYFTLSLFDNYGQTSLRNYKNQTITIAVDSVLDDSTFDDMKFLKGRGITFDDNINFKNTITVSDLFVSQYFEKGINPIGQTISIDLPGTDLTEDFVIVGVFEIPAAAKAQMYQPGQRDIDKVTPVYIPIDTYSHLSHSEEQYYYYAQIYYNTNYDPDMQQKVLVEFFNEKFAEDEKPYMTVEVENMQSTLSMINAVINVVTIAISVIAAISLIVGGVGVMNIMLVSITERTKEIGIRKALGAQNSSIRMQFVTEAILLCIIGGAIGIIIGIFNGMVIGNVAKSVVNGIYPEYASMFAITIQPSIPAIIISVLFSAATGVFFGYYPANKAAKMNPIDALRYD